LTPELEAAAAELVATTFQEYADEAAKILDTVRADWLKKGNLRSGGYLKDLAAKRADALGVHCLRLVDDLVALGLRVQPPELTLEQWLTARVDQFVSGQSKALLDVLEEQARLIASPDPAGARAALEHTVASVRNRVLQHVRLQFAKARLEAPTASVAHLARFIEERLRALSEIDAMIAETPYALGRGITPLDRWLEHTAQGLASLGLPNEAKRLRNEGYFGSRDPVLDVFPRTAAYRQFLGDLRSQAAGDPALFAGRTESRMATDPRKVAVVHGRNLRARDELFTFLRALDLSPGEWEDAVRATGKGAPYNGEVVQALFADTQAVVVLLTGDEEVTLLPAFRQSAADAAPRHQARPNVFFEAGMAFAVNPDRTILVEVGEQTRPSDLHGLNVIRYDGGAKARQTLKGRLETAGCRVTRSGTDWLTVGSAASPAGRAVSARKRPPKPRKRSR
jgi:predicted nucleotide-binding protein